MQSWFEKVSAAGELTKEMARTVSSALSDPLLTLQAATSLYQAVERHAKIVERLVADLEDEDVDESLVDAADALDDIMTELAAASAERMIALRQVR